MAEIQFPRGVRDLMPNEALFRNELLKKVEAIYQRFGFCTIDTPIFESLSVLRAKDAIGEENKLIYELQQENMGLRYDLTVSLARYYAMHSEIPLPFKRYAIGKAWRMDEPQRNRYREFTQADVDVLGGRQIVTDAEVIMAQSQALDAIGVDYELHVNDREVMDSVFAKLGIKGELHRDVYRAVDKLEKAGKKEVEERLSKLKLSAKQIDEIIGMVDLDAGNIEKLSFLEEVTGGKAERLDSIITMLGQYPIHGHVVVDLSMVRGLDYYTSTVFEFKSAKEGMAASIGGGGRYDNLVKLYSGREVPAVGASLGIDRIMDLLRFEESMQCTYSKVIVNYISNPNYPYALRVANGLRSAGINTEINLAQRNIANQLAYANSMKLGYAIIVGDEEQKSSKVKLRNLVSGEEEIISIDDAIKELSK